MATKMMHPLDAVRIGPRFHPAPAWPQAEQQFAPTHYVRVPDSPVMQNEGEYDNLRQNWNLRGGWVVGWRAHVLVLYADNLMGERWVVDPRAMGFVDLRLTINSHDVRFTDSENARWTPVNFLHTYQQGWLPWLVRVEPSDVWAWSYRSRWKSQFQPIHRVEIGLQFVADIDANEPVGNSKPDPQGSVMLARTLPSRWITPPVPYPELLPGQESAARRIDWQQGCSQLVGWCGHASQETEIEPGIWQQEATDPQLCNVEVQAAFHDSEHLIVNGSGPDWMSMQLLWGASGGRRFQPLCRKIAAQDQLTVRLRNTQQSGDVPIRTDVVLGWSREDDNQPRNMGKP